MFISSFRSQMAKEGLVAEGKNFISNHSIWCQTSVVCWYVFTKIHMFCHVFQWHFPISHQLGNFKDGHPSCLWKVITFMALKKCWKLIVGSQPLGETGKNCWLWLQPNHHHKITCCSSGKVVQIFGQFDVPIFSTRDRKQTFWNRLHSVKILKVW